MRPSAPRQVSLALALGFSIFFAPQLFTAGVPYYRDTLTTIIPFRHFIHQRLHAFELPQWYPREGLGVPFIGQIATATFHPQTLFFVWLPPVQAVKWNLLLMYALALCGGYRFARAFGHGRTASAAAAIFFAFGGYALGVSHNLVYAGAHALLPWVAAFAVQCTAKSPALRHAVALGCCWALLFLGGDAQAFLAAPLILAAALLSQFLGSRPPEPPADSTRSRGLVRSLLFLGSAGALAILLISPELLPALSVGADSLRAVGERSPTMGRFWALHPMRISEFICSGFVPDLVRNEFTGTFFSSGRPLWSTTLYFGAIPLLLAAAGALRGGRRHWPFAAGALLSLWLALGDYGGLMPLLAKALPLLGKFRFPEKYLSLLWLFCIPLVAAGVTAVRGSRRLKWVALSASGLVFALAFLLGAPDFVSTVRAGATVSAPFDEVVADAWRSGLLASATALLAVGLVILRARSEHRGVLIAALVFVELYRGNSAHLPLIPPEVLVQPNPIAAAVAPGARTVREVGVSAPSTVTLGDGDLWATFSRRSLKPNVAELDQVSTLSSNTPAMSWRYGILLGGKDAPSRTDLFHGCYRVTMGAAQPVAFDPDTGLALEPLRCEPRAFLAPARPVSNAFEALRVLESTAGRVLAVEGGGATVGSGSVSLAMDLPERVELDATADGPAALYLADGFASGWRASDNGSETTIFSANVAARAVYLAPGEHHVVFEYRTPSLRPGLVLGLLGWLIVVGVALSRIRLPLRVARTA